MEELEMKVLKETAHQQNIDLLLARVEKASSALADANTHENKRMQKFWGDQLEKAISQLDILQAEGAPSAVVCACLCVDVIVCIVRVQLRRAFTSFFSTSRCHVF